jgi:hypothetical protein
MDDVVPVWGVVGTRSARSHDGDSRDEPTEFLFEPDRLWLPFQRDAGQGRRQTERRDLWRHTGPLQGPGRCDHHPPGPIDSWLGETIVHAEDIRRPLGIAHTYPVNDVTRIAAFYRGSNLLIGGKRRAAGLTLRATDADWSAGSGPEVAGPAISLVLAITGRPAALDDLSGEGLAALNQRM